MKCDIDLSYCSGIYELELVLGNSNYMMNCDVLKCISIETFAGLVSGETSLAGRYR